METRGCTERQLLESVPTAEVVLHTATRKDLLPHVLSRD